MRFLTAVASVFAGVFVLIVLVDYVELMRRTADVPNVSAWLVAKISFFRVPQITERMLPFWVLVGAMSCYLGLSRRNELVVARAAGMSAWQFVAPAADRARSSSGWSRPRSTIRSRPRCAKRSKRLEAEIFGDTRRPAAKRATASGCASAATTASRSSTRIEPRAGRAADERQRLRVRSGRPLSRAHRGQARRRWSPATGGSSRRARLCGGEPPRDRETYLVKTNLTAEQVRESFSTPETVPFWQLPAYIEIAERAGLTAAGYRLQYQTADRAAVSAAAMVLLAAAFSLRFFRFGGVQKMVLGGVASGFLLYVCRR